MVLSVLGALVLAGTAGDVWTRCKGKKHEETGEVRHAGDATLCKSIGSCISVESR